MSGVSYNIFNNIIYSYMFLESICMDERCVKSEWMILTIYEKD